MRELERLAPDTLRIERTLDADADTVWRWLVDPVLRAQWFAGGTAADQVGELELIFNHDNLSADPVPYPPDYAEWKGAKGREHVLRIEPGHLLEWSWDGGKEGSVTFELFPSGEKTRFVLTHKGITSPESFANFGAGWLSHVTVLQKRIGGGVVRDFWALHRESQAAMAGWFRAQTS